MDADFVSIVLGLSWFQSVGAELVLSTTVSVARFTDADDDGTRPDQGSRPWLLVRSVPPARADQATSFCV